MGDASVVVVGGGFAGFWAALAAKRVGGSNVEIALVSRDPFLQVRPRLYEANPEKLSVDVRPFLAGASVRFICGNAIGIDAEDRLLRLASGDHVPYSRLVVTTGSRMRRPPIPGVELAHSIDTLPEAVALDERLKQLVLDRRAPRLAVIGAGFTGLELALELRDRLLAHAGDVAAQSARIHLFERADVVGPELGAGPRPVIEAALRDAGIEVHLGASVDSLAPGKLVIEGRAIEVDAVVLTTGMAAAEFAANIPGEHDRLGRVLVTRELRAPESPGVFVAGDSAAADTGDGHLALQSCQHALQMGRFAGENAARDLLGMQRVPYSQPRYVTCLDLGRSGAVLTSGWHRQVVEAGEDAKKTKRWINGVAIYPPADATDEELIARSSLDPAGQVSRKGAKTLPEARRSKTAAAVGDGKDLAQHLGTAGSENAQ
jgi:NADH dehydrogenase